MPDQAGVDGRQPLVHFVALQRSIEDFVLTRQAMAAAEAVAADKRVTRRTSTTGSTSGLIAVAIIRRRGRDEDAPLKATG